MLFKQKGKKNYQQKKKKKKERKDYSFSIKKYRTILVTLILIVS